MAALFKTKQMIREYTLTEIVKYSTQEWYYDRNNGFASNITVSLWSKNPNFGDLIHINVCEKTNEYLEVFINGELVYERTEEMIKREKQEFDLYASSLVESKKKELK